MSEAKSQQREREAVDKHTEEMERKVKAEGLDLDHAEGRERFDELLKRAAKPAPATDYLREVDEADKTSAAAFRRMAAQAPSRKKAKRSDTPLQYDKRAQQDDQVLLQTLRNHNQRKVDDSGEKPKK